MKGVVAFFRRVDEKSIQLVLNDVETSSPTECPDWKHDCFFTSNSYDLNSIQNMNLSKDDFAMIGENIVARLVAIGDLEK